MSHTTILSASVYTEGDYLELDVKYEEADGEDVMTYRSVFSGKGAESILHLANEHWQGEVPYAVALDMALLQVAETRGLDTANNMWEET